MQPLGESRQFQHLRRAVWTATGQAVVIKAFAKTNDDLEKVWRLWKSADRTYVAPLLYTAREPFKDGAGTWCFEVTEHFRDGTLHDYVETLEDRRLTEEQARHVLTQLTSAINYLHLTLASRERQQWLVHRDIKPSNVLVRGTDPLELVLTDFGSARLIMEDKKAFSAGLTPAYAAPEARLSLSPQMDWWSLGISMIELIQGSHPFINPTTAEFLPDDEILARVHSQQVPISRAITTRWQNLLRGLTSWTASDRWSATKVEEWLLGRDPEINASIGPTDATGRPFSFAGRSMSDPAELATAMSQNWAEAAALVLGTGWADLLHWCREVNPQLRADLDEVALRFIAVRGHVDRIVTETIVRLNRYGRPYYRGRPIEPANLVVYTRRAEEGDEEAREIIISLHESRSLATLGRLYERGQLAQFDEEWRLGVEVALPVVTDIPSWIGEIDSAALIIKILRACVDHSYGMVMRRQVDELAKERRARHAEWFVLLVKAARNGPPTLPLDALVLVSAPLLTRMSSESDPVLRKQAEHDLGIAGQAPAAPPSVPLRRTPERFRKVALWRTWPHFGAAGFRRPRYRAPFTRRQLLELLVVAVAGSLLVATVGTGIGISTSPTQGLLAGFVLVVGAGCLALSLTLRPSRLSGALLGAWLGMVFGFAVAAVLISLIGRPLGTATGWPAFWTTWAGIVMVTTARGAAR